MAKADKYIPTLKRLEGGYVGNFDGKICTNQGVTLATFRQYFGKDKTCRDLAKITDGQWRLIFLNGYWNKWKADSINNQSIANLLVDWLYTSGKWGIIFPQRILGVKDDGKVGKVTLSAINNHPNQKELFQQLWQRRKEHFESLAKNGKQKFLKGWLNRLNNFKYEENS